MRVLMTGGTGFVGRVLLDRLTKIKDCSVTAIVRQPLSDDLACVNQLQVSDIGDEFDWPQNSCFDVLIHCASRVHVMKETISNPLSEFRKTNVDATLRLARRAADNGIKRFIFTSSIKVNGETTTIGNPFRPEDLPEPVESYGQSKYEAELGLRDIEKVTGMEVVILRPVLIYGPGVKANFKTMMTWIDRGIPLPLRSIHNKRSLLSVDNLVDLIVVCCSHPKAAGETFLASDGEDISTTMLILRMAAAMNVKARLFSVPEAWLFFIANLLRKQHLAQRLCGSLQVDISKNYLLLGWTPPVTQSVSFGEVAKHYYKEKEKK